MSPARQQANNPTPFNGVQVAAVPLGELADIQVVAGPPMIKDENGVLVGFVFIDIDGTQRDLGGWVKDAKALVARRQVAAPDGLRARALPQPDEDAHRIAA